MAKKKNNGPDNLANNKKAFHEYHIENTYEAGIALKGTEVKSIREGSVAIKEAYCSIEGGEIFIEGMHVAPYEQGNRFNMDPLRKRKLLMHKREIAQLARATEREGYTIVPLNVHLTRGRVKISIAEAKGKKLHDKREAIKKRDIERDIKRYVDR